MSETTTTRTEEERESMSEKARLLLLEAQEACDHAVSNAHRRMGEQANGYLKKARKLGAEARENIDSANVIALNNLKDATKAVTNAIECINYDEIVMLQTEFARNAAIKYGGAYYEV